MRHFYRCSEPTNRVYIIFKYFRIEMIFVLCSSERAVCTSLKFSIEIMSADLQTIIFISVPMLIHCSEDGNAIYNTKYNIMSVT